MQIARISAGAEPATTQAPSTAGNSIQFTRPEQIAVRELHFLRLPRRRYRRVYQLHIQLLLCCPLDADAVSRIASFRPVSVVARRRKLTGP